MPQTHAYMHPYVESQAEGRVETLDSDEETEQAGLAALEPHEQPLRQGGETTDDEALYHSAPEAVDEPGTAQENDDGH
jgi:hypothetical protein